MYDSARPKYDLVNTDSRTYTIFDSYTDLNPITFCIPSAANYIGFDLGIHSIPVVHH